MGPARSGRLHGSVSPWLYPPDGLLPVMNRPSAGSGAQASFKDPRQPIGKLPGVPRPITVEKPRLVQQKMCGVFLKALLAVA
jgi:hypothetical protein